MHRMQAAQSAEHKFTLCTLCAAQAAPAPMCMCFIYSPVLVYACIYVHMHARSCSCRKRVARVHKRDKLNTSNYTRTKQVFGLKCVHAYIEIYIHKTRVVAAACVRCMRQVKHIQLYMYMHTSHIHAHAHAHPRFIYADNLRP